METCKVFVPCGDLGTGIEPKSFLQGIALGPDIISLDAGSTDSGPYYLGTANPQYARDAVKSDLRQILISANEKNIPVTIGSCGTCGTDNMVDMVADLCREIFAEEGFNRSIAKIYTEQSPAEMAEQFRSGNIRALEGALECNLAVVVHGTYQDAERLKNAFADFADRTNTIILAPLFPCGVIGRQDIHNYKFVRFHDIRFDEIVLDMVDDVRESFGLKQEKFLLYGFSGGGQFTHRMFYLHPERLHAVVIGAPGRATCLQKDSSWPDGIRNFQEIFGKDISFDNLRMVPVLLIVVSDDREVIDYSGDSTAPDGLAQYGHNRLERVRVLNDNYEANGISATLIEVPGAAHEEDKMLKDAQRFLESVILSA